MRVNDGGATRTTGTDGAGGSGRNSAAEAAERAAREAKRAAEAAARAAAEASRARAEAAARQAQEALKQAQAALAEAQKKGAPKAELTRAQQAVAQASTSAQQAAASARSAAQRESGSSSFVPSNAPLKPATTATTTPAVPAQQPSGPPGVTSGYTKEQASKDATELYKATQGGLTGWGTDEDAIFKTLDKKSPADVALIRQAFKEHYNLDLDATLRDELSGDDLTRAKSLLAGNKGNAGATAIQQEMGLGTDEEAILDTLRKATPAERQSIARSFQQMYGKDHPDIKAATPEEFLQKALDSELDGPQRAQLKDLLATTQARSPEEVSKLEAGAARSKVHDALQGFWGADSGKVFDTIKDLPPEQKKVLLQDTALQSELRDKLSKEDYTRARGMLEGNTAAASAAQINSATQGWLGTDEGAILDVLKNTKPEDLPALKAEYQKQTGRSLEAEVKSWGGADSEVGLRYLNPPAANDKAGQAKAAAEQLHRALDGMGTDEAALREVLGNKSKAEINDISAAYRELYKKDLRQDLTSELGGRDKFEIVDQMFDLGAIDPNSPTAARQQADRLRAQQKFEQSEGLGFIDTVQSWTKGESDSARLERNLDAAEAAISSGDTEAAQRRLGYSTDDVKTLQETKDSTADMAATAAVAVVTTAAVVATGGAATPLALAGYAALGAGTRLATQSYFKGDALGLDGAAQQALVGAVEGGTAVIPLPKGLSGAGRTVATESAEQVAKQTVGQRLRNTAIQGAWEGGIGGAAGGATDQALQSETWENGLMSGLAQVSKRAVVDGAVGTVFGAGGGVAMDGVMAGAQRLTRPREVPVSVNPKLEGRTVHVRYGDGRVRIEAGPKATDADIAAHMETARTLQKYEGPLGQVRKLRDGVRQELTSRPGYGTQGFESQLEVKKLTTLIKDLEGIQQRIDSRLKQFDGTGQVPTAAQREAIEREIANLRSQLDVHAKQVDSLAVARGYVAAEDERAGVAAARRFGYPLTKEEGLPEGYHWQPNRDDPDAPPYLQKNRGVDGDTLTYKPSGDELNPDPAKRKFGTFEVSDGSSQPKKIPDGFTREQAFVELGGNDPTKAFGKWMEVMKTEGIIKNDAEFIAKMKQNPGGSDADYVRHEAKRAFADKIAHHLTDETRLRGTQAYKDALKLKNAEGKPLTEREALAAASHSEMLRITSQLPSADKGGIANRWYEAQYGASRPLQREVTVGMTQANEVGGLNLRKNRHLDVVENVDGGVRVRELKNVSTAFGQGEMEQIEDNVSLLGSRGLLKGYDNQEVKEVVVTFLDPKGAAANVGFLDGLFKGASDGFKLEVYKPDGTSVLIDADTWNRTIFKEGGDPKAELLMDYLSKTPAEHQALRKAMLEEGGG
ncbi:annexin [Archangium violaceum]|uniref:annexin n=1 Tax=Archangium violaceum TaxID=83451 RepID=UPI002B30F7BF|nr:annexin [Archangium violaceum]